MGKLFFSALGLLMCSVTLLLFFEYRFFKRETEKMIVLKDDYRNHLVAVNKVLQDYNKIKEQVEGVSEDAKKKNEFPSGAHVVSSDDEDVEGADNFLTINRDLEYLKQSTIDYVKKQNLGVVLQRINLDDWRDYTQVVEQRSQKPVKKRARRRSAVSTARYEDALRQNEYNKIKDMSFAWPIERSSFWLSSMFGPRRKLDGSRGFHHGIDMAAVKGTSVTAAADGVIIEARRAQGYGNTIVIAHTRKYRTRYAHLSSMAVKVGQNVQRGQLIGRVGATGHVRAKKGRDGSHLHFEVSAYGKKVNPMYFLS